MLHNDSKTHTCAYGKLGEDAVASYLQQRGFTVIERNYRQRYGEVDLIACQSDVVAFVEVKARNQTNNFDHTQSITPAKQKKIIMTALRYLAQHAHQDKSYRFDVAIVEYNAQKIPTITYLENAFGVDE